jgi:hypothetical protein
MIQSMAAEMLCAGEAFAATGVLACVTLHDHSMGWYIRGLDLELAGAQ